MAISPSGIGYFETKPEDIVVMTLDGMIIDGNRKPSSEHELHSVIYKIKPEARGVVHTPVSYTHLDVYKRQWIDSVIRESVDLFKDKFTKRYDELCTDCMAKTEGFKEYYLEGVIHDAAGIAGCELIRRVVGVAKVKDLTEIKDNILRMEQEKKIISIAKEFIKNREKISSGKQFLVIVKKNL